MISLSTLFRLIILIFLIYPVIINKTLANEPTTIYTPNGTQVNDTWILDEFSPGDIEYLTWRVGQEWPNASRVNNSVASRT